MMRRQTAAAAALSILLLLLAACGENASPSASPTAATGDAARTATVAPTQTATVPPTPSPAPTMTPSPTPLPEGLLVETQVLRDDGIIRVAEAVSGAGGWVVVHADEEGAPGVVLGATALPAGVSSDITVVIDPLLATGRLFVMLHIEGGGDDVFDPAVDTPHSVDGAVISTAVEIDLQISVPVLAVADQRVDEETPTVVIPGVTALAPGWLAIYSVEAGGPGRLLAYSAVPAGRSSNITLAINRYNATPTLLAALHTDDGEIGRFEPELDPLVVVGSEPLLVSFAVTLPLDIVMLDQPIVDDRLVVGKVLVNEPAWVAVYYDDENGTSWVVGFALLEPGINENVVVDLIAQPPVTSLYLRLHVDQEDPGVFEFPGADGPLLVDGRLPAPIPFITNPGNYLIARDQAPVDGAVTIPLIVVDLPIWVVVYEAAEGARGPELGRVRQPAGLLLDVVVPLATTAADTVIVTLHRDDGDELFEPDGGDTALLRNRAVIETPFTLLTP